MTAGTEARMKDAPEVAARPAATPRATRVVRWQRIGGATQFGGSPDARQPGVGWSWTFARPGDEQRLVQVRVSVGAYAVTDLPAETRNAIRSRGATAVDLYLDRDEPPARIVVSIL